MSKKSERFELKGTVVDTLPSTKFKVEVGLDNGNARIVDCTLSGRLRINNIRILVGDKVTIDVSTDDPTRGRIVWRER